jgi:hypothetical protein
MILVGGGRVWPPFGGGGRHGENETLVCVIKVATLKKLAL